MNFSKMTGRTPWARAPRGSKGDGKRKTGATVASGAAAAWPICLGYFPIGLAFGVVAQKAGITPVEIGLMSCLVYAGSAQFIAVSMLASGAGTFAVILTTFTINLRHLLMSSALSVHLGLKDHS